MNEEMFRRETFLFEDSNPMTICVAYEYEYQGEPVRHIEEVNAELLQNRNGGLPIHVDNPSEIGNDLIAVMVGAKKKYSYPVLIADLGTASKIMLIDKSGTFVSCTIMPGLSLGAASLTNKAALLPEISFKTPKTVLAKNTVDAINAGVLFGHADMIDGLIDRFEKEIGYKCQHVLTGGGSIYIKDVLKNHYEYDPDVCLEGLNEIIRRNEVK